MNQRYFNWVFCDLPMFSILLLSATSSSGTVQHFVLEKKKASFFSLLMRCFELYWHKALSNHK